MYCKYFSYRVLRPSLRAGRSVLLPPPPYTISEGFFLRFSFVSLFVLKRQNSNHGVRFDTYSFISFHIFAVVRYFVAKKIANMPITRESRITPTLSSMHPQTHTPISNYNIQQIRKICNILNIVLNIIINKVIT